MPNPNPKVISYPIPKKFQNQIEAEVERLGCYTKVEAMGRIIAYYFSEHPDHKPQVEETKAKEKETEGGTPWPQ